MTDRRISCFLPVLAALLSMGAWHTASAQAAESQQPVVRATHHISMDQAVRMAEQRFKARVVRAESQQDDGRTVYVLRMLNESGRVWTVRVDATSGAVL